MEPSLGPQDPQDNKVEDVHKPSSGETDTGSLGLRPASLA